MTSTSSTGNLRIEAEPPLHTVNLGPFLRSRKGTELSLEEGGALRELHAGLCKRRGRNLEK